MIELGGIGCLEGAGTGVRTSFIQGPREHHDAGERQKGPSQIVPTSRTAAPWSPPVHDNGMVMPPITVGVGLQHVDPVEAVIGGKRVINSLYV